MKNYKLVLPALALIVGPAIAVHAETLTTTYALTEVAGGNWTNLFDLTVINPSGLQFTEFTVNILQTGAPRTLDIYFRPTTYVGSENTSVGWTLISTGTSTAPIANGPDIIDVTDFTLSMGTYGFALINTNYQVGYTTGATDYSNANLLIDNGATTQGPLSGTVTLNKTWNGAITYNVVPEPAALVLIGIGIVAILGKRRLLLRDVSRQNEPIN